MRSQSPLPKRFPFRLHEMLNDAEEHGTDDIVSWLACGKMFKVHKHKLFAKVIMPKYCRHNQYRSFLRQLSMYKFSRINRGEMRGVYHHPNFQRNRLDLIERINRKERTVSSSQATSIQTKAIEKDQDMPDDSTSSSSTGTLISEKNNSSHPPVDELVMSEDFELIDFSLDSQSPTKTIASHLKLPRSKSSFARHGKRKLGSCDIVQTRHVLENSTEVALPTISTPEDILNEIICTFSRRS